MPGLEYAPHGADAETVDQQVTPENETPAIADQQAVGLKLRQRALLDKPPGQRRSVHVRVSFKQLVASLPQDGTRRGCLYSSRVDSKSAAGETAMRWHQNRFDTASIAPRITPLCPHRRDHLLIRESGLLRSLDASS